MVAGVKAFRRHAKWFFCMIAFDFLREALSRASANPAALRGDALRALLEDAEFVAELLRLSDRAVEDSFEDSIIRRKTDDHRDDKRFLQNGCADRDSMASTPQLYPAWASEVGEEE